MYISEYKLTGSEVRFVMNVFLKNPEIAFRVFPLTCYKYGSSILHFAALYDITFLDFLLKNKVLDVNIRDDNGYTPLNYVCFFHSKFWSKRTQLAVMIGGDVRGRSFKDRLVEAGGIMTSECSDMEQNRVFVCPYKYKLDTERMVRILNQYNVYNRFRQDKNDIQLKDTTVSIIKKLRDRFMHGCSLLHIAAVTDYYSLVQLIEMIKVGDELDDICVDMPDYFGFTPIHYVCFFKDSLWTPRTRSKFERNSVKGIEKVLFLLSANGGSLNRNGKNGLSTTDLFDDTTHGNIVTNQ